MDFINRNKDKFVMAPQLKIFGSVYAYPCVLCASSYYSFHRSIFFFSELLNDNIFKFGLLNSFMKKCN